MAVQVSYPGVYIEEFAPGAPIQGVGTNTAAFIGVAFDGHRVLRILVEPNGLLAQDILPFAGQGRAVDLEMNDIADIRGKILSRAGLR